MVDQVELRELIEQAEDRALYNLAIYNERKGGTAFREGAFQWFAIADALRARTPTTPERSDD